MFGSLPRVPPQKCRFERPHAERRKTGTDPVKPLDTFRCRRLRHVRVVSVGLGRSTSSVAATTSRSASVVSVGFAVVCISHAAPLVPGQHRGEAQDVHPALQKGEGRHTVGSECDDPAVKDGFAVIKHSTECVDDLGERGTDCCCRYATTAPEPWNLLWLCLFGHPTYSLRPNAPRLGDARAWRASAALAFRWQHSCLPLCAGLYWFRRISRG